MGGGATEDGQYDVAVVGAGIVGLAHAYAAAKLGARVVVIERDLAANGASIRNFGFITVTGQARGEVWRMAMRARDVWAEVAAPAGIPIEHRGLVLTLRRPEAVAVARGVPGDRDGRRLRAAGRRRAAGSPPRDRRAGHAGRAASARTSCGWSRAPPCRGWPRGWRRRTASTSASARRRWGSSRAWCATSRGPVRARFVVVCPGDDFASLYPDRLAPFDLTRCRLSMLRLASPGFALPGGVMSDLGLVRYAGYAALPEAEALRTRLQAEQPRHLANGVHLIAVQSADGSLVVGDSHHYGEAPSPFAPAEAEALILDEFQRATGLAPPPVIERWTGTYAVASDRTWLIDAPADDVRLVMVTTGCGASIGFGLAEAVINPLLSGAKNAAC